MLLGPVPANLIAWMAGSVSQYSAYRKDKRKEDDLLVRKRLESEVLKSHDNIRNIMEILNDAGDTKSMVEVKRVKDELDVFVNEVSLSTVGHHYPFFSLQHVRTPSSGDLKKLVEYDGDMIYRMTTVKEALDTIQSHLIDGTAVDYPKEFATIRQYVTNSRNKYRDREDYLRGWK